MLLPDSDDASSPPLNAFDMSGIYADKKGSLDRARAALAAAGDDRRQLGHALLASGLARTFIGDYQDAASDLAAACDHLAHVGDLAGELCAIARLSACQRYTGRGVEDGPRLRDALARVRDIDAPSVEWELLNSLAWLHYNVMEFDDFATRLIESLDYARRHDLAFEFAASSVNVTNMLTHIGDHEQAIALCKETLQLIAADPAFDNLAAPVQYNLGRSKAALGDVDAGIAAMQQSAANAERNNDLFSVGGAEMEIAQMYRQKGQSDEAHAAAQRAERAWQSLNYPEYQLYAH